VALQSTGGLEVRGLAGVAIVCAVLAAGCGGSDKKSDGSGTAPPKPKEPVAAYATRLQNAMAAFGKGDCAGLKTLNKSAGFAFFCNAQAKKAYAGFKVTGSESLSTAGVVEFTDAEVKKAPLPPGTKSTPSKKRGVVVVAIGADGKFAATGPVVPIFPATSIGTKAPSHADQDLRAQAFLDSVRLRDCAKFFKYAVTPGVRSAQEACKKILDVQYSALAKALKAAKDTKPVYEAGNERVTVYGVRTGKEYRTLTVVKGAPRDPEPYLVMGTTRGPKS
jgi:hypothetical protein